MTSLLEQSLVEQIMQNQQLVLKQSATLNLGAYFNINMGASNILEIHSVKEKPRLGKLETFSSSTPFFSQSA